MRGLEAINAHAFARCIYIHGTPQENFIGRPASYGCIRMKSNDVADLYNQLNLGALVQIVPDPLPKIPKAKNFRGIPEEKEGTERHTCSWREKYFKRARAAFGRSRLTNFAVR